MKWLDVEIQELKRRIRELSTGKLGSFGEYMFEREMMAAGHEVASVRGDGISADFVVDGRKIDVKTTRTKMAFQDSKYCLYNKPVQGVEYAQVIFLANKVKLYYRNGLETFRIGYQEVKEYWGGWINHRNEIKQAKKGLRQEREQIKIETKKRLKSRLGFEVHAIYRGMENEPNWSENFRNPDNLIMKKGENLSVCIRFKENSTKFHDGVCLPRRDIEEAKIMFMKSGKTEPPTLPMTHSNSGKLIVDIKKVRENLQQHPKVLISEPNMTLEEFEDEIIRRFTMSTA